MTARRSDVRRRSARSVNGMRRTSLCVQLTAQQRAALEMSAQNKGLSLSRALVDAAFSAAASDHVAGDDVEEMVRELRDLRRQVIGIATNVNQLAHHANATQEFPTEASKVTEDVRSVLREIEWILGGIRR